jgi:MGT family glycosyltransferase
MAKYIFVNVPGHGHVNPTLAVVQELVKRGEQVVYFLSEEFRAVIEATGATFRPYITSIFGGGGPNPIDPTGKNSVPMPILLAQKSEQMVDELLEPMRAEQGDVLVYDFMCLWGGVLGKLLNIPAVLLRPSYAGFPKDMRALAAQAQESGVPLMGPFAGGRPGAGGPEGRQPEGGAAGTGPFSPGNPMVQFMAQIKAPLAALYQKYGLPPDSVPDVFFKNVEPLTISFIPRSFQPDSENFDEHVVFVGPSINTSTRPDTTDFPLTQLEGKQVLFISLGTAFNNQVEFYKTCIAAFKDMPLQVVLAYGTRINPAELDPIPANFLARPHVPQLDILPHASVFISHGGMNSTMESLYHGVPLIEFPQMVEQMLTASRIQELGLGIILNRKELSPETLRTAVDRVMNDTAMRARVHDMQQQIRTSGGYQLAADALIDYARHTAR